jgi:hypothetical protein
MGAMQRSRARRLAAHAVPLDQREDQIRRGGQNGIQFRPGLPAQLLLDLIGRHPQTGIHQPHIASRSAMTDRLGFQQPDFRAPLHGVQGGGAAGEAAADDHQIGYGMFIQRRCPQIRAGRHPPEILFRLVEHRPCLDCRIC